MEHARHVFRVAFVLLLVIVVTVLGRALVIPKSYGLYGPYRFDNVAEQANARPPLHGGAAACGECHGERLAAITAGAHRAVSCEVCHGPLGRHVNGSELVAAMPVDRSPKACARCHRRIDGRPAAFKQVVLEQHVPAGAETCLDCHDPHSPKP